MEYKATRLFESNASRRFYTLSFDILSLCVFFYYFPELYILFMLSVCKHFIFGYVSSFLKEMGVTLILYPSLPLCSTVSNGT